MAKKNPNIVHKITNFLRQEITHSNLKPLQHIKEYQIAKKFNVSRVPVRESLRILQSEGYLKVIPHKGCFVKKISLDYLVETGIVYRQLAPYLLEKAVPNYTQNTYIKAGEILDKIENCDDLNKAGYLLWDFGKVIYGPSKMKFILGIFDDIYRHNIRLLNDVFEIAQKKNYDVAPHRKFLQLCRTNQKKEAIKHWSDYTTKIEQLILDTSLKK